MLLQALTSASGPPSSPLFRGLPAVPGFNGTRCHLKADEILEVSDSVGKQKLTEISQDRPIFRELSKDEEAEYRATLR